MGGNKGFVNRAKSGVKAATARVRQAAAKAKARPTVSSTKGRKRNRPA